LRLFAIVHHILPSELFPQTLPVRSRLLTDPCVVKILSTGLGLIVMMDPRIAQKHPVLKDVQVIHLDQVEPTVLRDHVLEIGHSPILMMPLTIIGRIVREPQFFASAAFFALRKSVKAYMTERAPSSSSSSRTYSGVISRFSLLLLMMRATKS